MWFVGTVPETKPVPVSDLLDGLSLSLDSSSSPSSNFSVLTALNNYKTLNSCKLKESSLYTSLWKQEKRSINQSQHFRVATLKSHLILENSQKNRKPPWFMPLSPISHLMLIPISFFKLLFPRYLPFFMFAILPIFLFTCY